MKRGGLALCLTLSLLGTASAQDLGAYRTLAGELDAAASGAGRDAIATLKRLDAAQAALDKLKPTLGSQVATGLQDTVNAVRAAQARTPEELQAQVHLARGQMRKALYDQTLALLSSAPGNGTAQVELLAREFGLEAQALLPDARAGRLNVVAWQLQRNAANKLNLALNNVPAEQSGTAYLRLARAASWYPVLQETGKHVSPPLEAGQFTQALGQVASGDVAGLKRSLTQIRAGAQAVTTLLKTAPSTGEAVAQNPAEKAEKVPPVAPSNGGNAEVVPAGQGNVGDTRSGGATTLKPSAASTAQVYASLGRALVAAGQSDLVQARTELRQSSLALEATPASIRSRGGYDSLARHLQELSTRQVLKPMDVQAVMAEWTALEQNRPMRLLESVALGSSRLLGGPVHSLLALLLALSCAIPLYLLHLAFGRQNPYWRAISAALVLLLLPALTDGIFGALGWLGETLNMPMLTGLLSLTPGQSALGWPVRLLVTALAVGLATYGFRGLCEQFGLLSGQRPRSAARVQDTPESGSRDAKVTSFDWDEEV